MRVHVIELGDMVKITDEKSTYHAMIGKVVEIKLCPDTNAVEQVGVNFTGETPRYPSQPKVQIFNVDELKIHRNPSVKPDMVNHPPHYNQGGVECIDALRAAIGDEAFKGHCTATAIKYLWRWQQKGGVQDLEKSIWYIKKCIEVANAK